MIVVMVVGASEAEILGVKSQILAEGMSPYDHAGSERVVIAVVGEVGMKKQVLASRLAALPAGGSTTRRPSTYTRNGPTRRTCTAPPEGAMSSAGVTWCRSP